MGDEPPGWSSVSPTQKHSTKGLTVSTRLSGRPTSWLKNNPEILMDNMQLALDINGWPGSMAGQTSSSRISSPFLVENITSQKHPSPTNIYKSHRHNDSNCHLHLSHWEKTPKQIWYHLFVDTSSSKATAFISGQETLGFFTSSAFLTPRPAEGAWLAARGGCDNVTSPCWWKDVGPDDWCKFQAQVHHKIISMEGNHVWV